MPKMTDQEFDHLFQQAANRISPRQQQGDWEDMQRRLEAAERDARARNISLYSMLVLLLLYSFVVPENFKKRRADQASFVPQVEQVQQGESTASIGAHDKTSAGDKTIDEQQNVANASVKQQAVDASLNVDAASNSATEANQSADNAGAESTSNATVKQGDVAAGEGLAAGEQHSANTGKAGNNKNEKPTNADKAIASGTGGTVTAGTGANSGQTASATSLNASSPSSQHSGKVPEQSVGVPVVTGQAAITAADNVQGSAVKNSAGAEHGTKNTSPNEENVYDGSATSNAIDSMNKAGLVSSSAVVLNTPSTDPLFAEPEMRAKQLRLYSPGTVVASHTTAQHPLFVKLAISPDFSSIDYGSAGKAGLNFGPMVEYGLSPRFSISTGAIWSKKLYDQENPSKTYNQGGGYPLHAKMLNGDCRILDIPLNVTYYMMPGRKTSLFVSVGSSSYIMLNEEYVYTVTHNNRDYEYVETYSHENNEWFSMLNLSTGIQHQVGKRWFVQGEPFLKAPMKGIGAGKVNLVSAGVFVSVKYWLR